MAVFTLEAYTKLISNGVRSDRDITRGDENVATVLASMNEVEAQLKKVSRHSGPTGLSANIELAVTREELRDRREQLKEELKNAKLLASQRALDRLNRELEERRFSWGLRPGIQVSGRQTFSISDEFFHQITAKQVEHILATASNRFQPSRKAIVTGLRHALAKPYSYGIIRTDIENFFGSVSHGILLDLLSEIERVDSVSRFLIEQLLDEYSFHTKSTFGIPQGVGMSSRLAEILLIKLDQAMITDPRVEYYARFVDDIIVLTKDKRDNESVRMHLELQISGLGLKLNSSKTQDIEATSNGDFQANQDTLGYLGYEFFKQQGKIETKLSTERFERLLARLERTFEIWKTHQPKCKSHENCSADGLLIQRIRFLTSNVRLHNAKGRVVVGIYYSNRELTELSQLKILDRKLKESLQMLPGSLKKKISDLSFLSGFQERTFSRFSVNETERITNCWKDLQ